MATIIHSDGTHEEVAIPRDPHDALAFLQSIVGGYIEVISLLDPDHQRQQMILNEEGKLEHLPYNHDATVLGRLAGIGYDDYIVGDVILATPHELGEDDNDE